MTEDAYSLVYTISQEFGDKHNILRSKFPPSKPMNFSGSDDWRELTFAYYGIDTKTSMF